MNTVDLGPLRATQSGAFLVKWLIGVAIGSVIVGGGAYFALEYWQQNVGKGNDVAVVSSRTQQSAPRENQQDNAAVQYQPPSRVVDNPPVSSREAQPTADVERHTDDGAQMINTPLPTPQAAGQAAPAYLRLPDGRVVAVPEDASVEDVLEAQINGDDDLEGFDAPIDEELDEESFVDDEDFLDDVLDEERVDFERAEAARIEAAVARESRAASEVQRRLDQLRIDEMQTPVENVYRDDEEDIAPRIPD